MKLHLPQLTVSFLGTSAAWPSAKRNVASTAIKWGSEVLLFDCGEGTQRQLQKSDLSYMAVRTIFLTHLHGDHHYGLPGLLKTMQLNERTEPLEIVGPPGLRDLMAVYDRIARVHDQYPVKVTELKDGDVWTGQVYKVAARKLNHGIYNLGYSFMEPDRPGRFDKPTALELGVPEGPMLGKLQRGESIETPAGRTVRPDEVMGTPRKGRTIVITGDTAPCEALVELAQGSDLLIAEATYCQDMVEKAAEYGHMTAAQAAEMARRSGVRRLVLTHISPRYTDDAQHREEATAVFPETEIARDLMSMEVPLVD